MRHGSAYEVVKTLSEERSLPIWKLARGNETEFIRHDSKREHAGKDAGLCTTKKGHEHSTVSLTVQHNVLGEGHESLLLFLTRDERFDLSQISRL